MCDRKISSFAYSEALHNVAPLEILKKSFISRTTRQNSQDCFLTLLEENRGCASCFLAGTNNL